MTSKPSMHKLFGVSWTPRILFGVADLPDEVRRAVGKMSLSGVQRKAIVKLQRRTKTIEIAQGRGTHILKPDIPDYPQISLVENCCMDMAEKLEMEVPPHTVLPMADGTPAYLIKRFDRLPGRRKIHKEDMAQLLRLSTDEKYNGSLEKVGKIIRQYATNTFLDLTNFYERILFNFLIGNGDMHLKNWALLETEEEIKLAPCYDFVSSHLYIANEDESALTLNGKRNKIDRSDFEKLSENLDLGEIVMKNIFEKFKHAKPLIVKLIHTSGLKLSLKDNWLTLVKSRYERLGV